MITKAPGIEDIFPDRIDQWNHVVHSARRVFASYNYREIIIPIMEFTEVFSRGLGDETDIVSKEMFTFEDRGGRSLTLRPEGTASVVRAYLENGDYHRLSSCKLFYVGPMFRAERPQKGRLRQFNQFGAEFFGSADPFYDYEIIAMIDHISATIGITGYTLLINSIGCPECRPSYIAELTKYYESKNDELCEDCKKRLHKNVFRLLDCKNEKCGTLKKSAPVITAHLCEHCAKHHAAVKHYLDKDAIAYTEDPFLVRGLDYYTRTTFEFVTTKLGGQNAFAAGGRYDNLVETFGGKPTPAVGFAAGIERICLMLEDAAIPKKGISAYIVHSGGATLVKAIEVLAGLRKQGFSADLEPGSTGFKGQLKKAEREKASYAIIIGGDELAEDRAMLKNMATGEQKKVSFNELAGELK